MVLTKGAIILVEAVLVSALMFPTPANASTTPWVCGGNVVGKLCVRHNGDKLQAKYYPPSGRTAAGIFSIRTGKVNYVYKFSKHRYVEEGEVARFTWKHPCRTRFKANWYSNAGTDPMDLYTPEARC
ncbi:hypothetical protein [Nonomuraea sp. CA-141351]|uniref:hypothetical protein n=1 Tax=Nonomuraea sp. CA-141351 TaxID=3239996 RepID=UPI003D91E184